MRKTLFIAVLATCLLFAFSGVAMAKYAGYAYNQVPGAHPGYLSWDGATAAADFYSGGTEDTSTPHGNYTANTVKCAVCHSVHRAFAPVDNARNSNTQRPAAGNIIITSSSPDTHLKLTAGFVCTACHTASGATPVDKLIEWPSAYTDGGPHARQRCVGACHAGVHGANLSDYEVASSFMLNPVLDAGMAAAITAGNVGGGVTATTLDTSWNSLSAGEQQGNRAMVTGYLCAQAGCHTSSQFAVNQWSYGDMTASNPGASSTLDLVVTGHRTSMVRTSTCGGSTCHSNDAFTDGRGRDSSCALCHDMVGVATNTTAFPHANRAIQVYEWERPAGALVQTNRVIGDGNLWMYGGDATYRLASGEPTTTLMWDGYVPDATVVGGYANNRINTRKVIEDAAAFDLTNMVVGNINDGTCLKCHGFNSYFHGSNLDGDFSSDRIFSNY